MSEISAVDQPSETQLLESKFFEAAEYLRDTLDFKYAVLVGDIERNADASNEYLCEVLVNGVPLVMALVIDGEEHYDVEDRRVSIQPFDRKTRDLQSGREHRVQVAHVAIDRDHVCEYEPMSDQATIIEFVASQRAALASQVHGRRALGRAFAASDSYLVRPAFSGMSRLSWTDSPESLEIVDACVVALIGGLEADTVRLDSLGLRIRGPKIGDANDREHLFAVGVSVDGFPRVVEFSCAMDQMGVVETFVPRFDKPSPAHD